jgi:hypothetical protein
VPDGSSHACQGYYGFFRLSLAHDTLENYYTSSYYMVKGCGFTLTEIENLIPFEKELYIMIMKRDIEDQKEQAKSNN